jgi:gas vesicle protein
MIPAYRDIIRIMATEDTGISLAWFLVGAAVGATVALLYAPQSGRETRRLISKKTEQSREAIADSGKEVLDRGRELYERGREFADEAAELFERGKKAVRG